MQFLAITRGVQSLSGSTNFLTSVKDVKIVQIVSGETCVISRLVQLREFPDGWTIGGGGSVEKTFYSTMPGLPPVLHHPLF